MQIESVLQTKNWSEPAKTRFSVALLHTLTSRVHPDVLQFDFYGAPYIFEPQHDKTNKMNVRPAKTQISLGSLIRVFAAHSMGS